MKTFSEGRLKQLTVGPSRSPIGRERQRRDASERAAFRRAGMRRTQSGGNRLRFSSTNNQNEFSRTAITSYPSQTYYAKDMLPSKEKEGTEKGVRSTKNRALYLRRLRRQLRTTRTRRGVHNVDILPTGNFSKNDSNQLIKRGKEFQTVVKEIPQEVKKAGGKSGDKIVGKAAEVLSGSTNIERGRQKRRELYSKLLGASSHDPVTNIQVAKVKEEMTFKKFMAILEEYYV